jgi:hypothetical protein
MYKLIKIKDKNDSFYVQVGDFYIGETFLVDDGTWHSVVKNDEGYVVLRYCDTNLKKAAEGLLMQMVYKSYYNLIKGL